MFFPFHPLLVKTRELLVQWLGLFVAESDRPAKEAPVRPEHGTDIKMPPFERRQSQFKERRSSLRKGKFDRRKNRCGDCVFFKEDQSNPKGPGYCQKHQTPMAVFAFACLYFKKISNSD